MLIIKWVCKNSTSCLLTCYEIFKHDSNMSPVVGDALMIFVADYWRRKSFSDRQRILLISNHQQLSSPTVGDIWELGLIRIISTNESWYVCLQIKVLSHDVNGTKKAETSRMLRWHCDLYRSRTIYKGEAAKEHFMNCQQDLRNVSPRRKINSLNSAC